MVWPKVSILWLNYNSSKILDIVLKSLEGIADLDYPNDRYELIFVDNGSTDGSFEKVKEFLDKKTCLKKKIIKLDKNLGFTGGNNIAYRARDKESNYIVLLNNDAIPYKESIKIMIEYIEQLGVAGLNGVILKYGENSIIDTAGDFIDELITPYFAGNGKKYPWIIRKPFYITFADGAFALYRVDNIQKCVGYKDKLFIDELFGYGDDGILGLMLWNCGYRIASIPHIVAEHKRSSTFSRSPLGMYLNTRNHIAMLYLTNSRYRTFTLLHALRGPFGPKVLSYGVYVHKIVLQGIYEGIKLAKHIYKKYRMLIDMYKAPVLRLQPYEILRYYIFGTGRMIRDLQLSKFEDIIEELRIEHS